MVPAKNLLPAIREVVRLLKPHCVALHVGGSVRRQKQDVKDVEIIAIPDVTLLAALDAMVEQGVIAKARYPDTKYRWGERYRGILFEGVRFEIFCCDHDNHGYQLWLRTGPSEANHYVMSVLQQHNTPFGFATWGYFGERVYKKGKWEFVPDQRRKLSIPDEQTMFALLGMTYLEPQDRSLERYKAVMTRRAHRFGDATPLLIPPAKDQPLFADVDVPAATPSSPRRVLDIDEGLLPPYSPGSSFEQEQEVLTRLLVSCGDHHAPTEDEVVLFAERRYQLWDHRNREDKR